MRVGALGVLGALMPLCTGVVSPGAGVASSTTTLVVANRWIGAEVRRAGS